MMDQGPRTERNRGKDEAASDTAGTAMERFKALARKLVRVPVDELRAKRETEPRKAREPN
jgi:hypothetical protein